MEESGEKVGESRRESREKYEKVGEVVEKRLEKGPRVEGLFESAPGHDCDSPRGALACSEIEGVPLGTGAPWYY